MNCEQNKKYKMFDENKLIFVKPVQNSYGKMSASFKGSIIS